MKLTVERTALASAMSRVAAIVDSKQVVPILGNVMLSAAGDRLSIRATNLDMEALEYIPANVEVEGETTVNASKLSTLANSLPIGAQIAMALDMSILTVTSGRTRIKLGCLHPVTFPALWAEEWPVAFEIDAEHLAAMLDRVAFAQSTGGSRTYLQGTNFSTVGGRLRAAAIEGAFMSYCDGPELTSEVDSLTMPTRMITEVIRLLAGVKGPVTLSMSNTKAMVRFEDVSITSKLIDRSLAFPDFIKLFPADLDKIALINVASMTAAIRRALIASQNAKDNTVRVTFKPGAVAVSSRNAEADAFDEIDADFDGDETEIALHPQYLTAMLEHLPGEVAEFHFRDNKVAVTIRAVGDETGICLIMPQRVGA